MKRNYIFLSILLLSCFNLHAQEGDKVSLGLNYGFGCHYANSEVNNPQVLKIAVGYEYNFFDFLGLGVGFMTGGFKQKADLPIKEVRSQKEVYRASFFAPYLAPKFYLEVGSDESTKRGRFLYLENRFSYNLISYHVDKVDNYDISDSWEFGYTVLLGYQHPIAEKWAVDAWLGYDVLDYGKAFYNHLKTSTPFQVGVGFSYMLRN